MCVCVCVTSCRSDWDLIVQLHLVFWAFEGPGFMALSCILTVIRSIHRSAYAKLIEYLIILPCMPSNGKVSSLENSG